MIKSNREKQDGDHEMAVMDRTGDTKVVWNKFNEAEIVNAKLTFEDLRSKGFLAFKLSDDGEKGEQIVEFDPTIQMMIMIPPMQGG